MTTDTEKKTVAKKSDKEVAFSGKAKNMSDRTIQLSGKQVKPGEIGECSAAELSTFFKYVEKV